MFKLVSNPTFTHDIDVTVPVDGGFEPQSLKVTFRVLDAVKLDSFDLRDPKQQREFCMEAVESFGDVLDQNGKPVPHNDVVKAALIDTPYVRAALLSSYSMAVVLGRAKN